MSAAVAPEGSSSGGGEEGFKLLTSFPECCAYGCCCFEMKYRSIPDKSDKDAFCTGRYTCYRFAYNCHDCEIPSCQYFCLGFNAGGGFEGMSIFPGLKKEEGFKPFIPSDLPTFHTCCVEQCCCFRVAMCQPCFGMCGDPEVEPEIARLLVWFNRVHTMPNA